MAPDRNTRTTVSRDSKYIIQTPKLDPVPDTRGIKEVDGCYTCPGCGHSYRSPYNISKHFDTSRRCSKKLVSPSSSTCPSTKRRKIYSCEHCSKTSRRSAEIERHLQIYHSNVNPSASSFTIPNDLISFSLLEGFVPVDIYAKIWPVLAVMPLWLAFSANLFIAGEETISMQSFWAGFRSWTREERSHRLLKQILEGHAVADPAVQQQVIVRLCKIAMAADPAYNVSRSPKTREESQELSKQFLQRFTEQTRAAEQATDLWQTPLGYQDASSQSYTIQELENFLAEMSPLCIPSQPFHQEQQLDTSHDFSPDMFNIVPEPIISPPDNSYLDNLAYMPDWMDTDLFPGVQLPTSCWFDDMGYQLSHAPDWSENAAYHTQAQDTSSLLPDLVYPFESLSSVSENLHLSDVHSSYEELMKLAGF